MWEPNQGSPSNASVHVPCIYPRLRKACSHRIKRRSCRPCSNQGRGSTVSEATYRRYTRNDLKLCGLVDFPCSKGGRDSATVYTFPAFMRLYGIVDNLGTTAQEPAKPCTGLPVQNVRDMYGLTGTKHAQKVASIELLEDRYMGMEEGYSIYPQETPLPIVENPQPQQQQSRPRHGNVRESYCPKCKALTRFKRRDGATFFTCTRCGNNAFLPDD